MLDQLKQAFLSWFAAEDSSLVINRARDVSHQLQETWPDLVFSYNESEGWVEFSVSRPGLIRNVKAQYTVAQIEHFSPAGLYYAVADLFVILIGDPTASEPEGTIG